MRHIKKLLASVLILALMAFVAPLIVYASNPFIQTGTIDLSLSQQTNFRDRNGNATYSSGGNTYYYGTATITSTVKFVVLSVVDSGSTWTVSYNISGYISISSSRGVYESYSSSSINLTVNGTFIPATGYYYDRSTVGRTYDYTQYPANKVLSLSVPKTNGSTNYGLKLDFNVNCYYSAMTDYNYYYSYNASLNINQDFIFDMNQPPQYANITTTPAQNVDASYLSGQPGMDKYIISGKTWDAEQQPLTITLTVQYYDSTYGGYRSIIKSTNINSPPNIQPATNNFTLTVDVNNDKLTGGISFADGQYYNTYLTITDGYDPVYIYPSNIIVDKTKPTVTTTTTKVKGGSAISYSTNDNGDLFLVKDGSYTYDQLASEADGVKGNRKTVTSGSGTINTPTTDGYYKLFMADRARNISDVSTGTIVVDTKAPRIVSSIVDGDTVILTFDQKLGAALPLPDDLFYVKSESGDMPKFIADEDIVSFSTYYSDYESDPVYEEYFVYSFQSCFENPNGMPAFNGQALNTPVTSFHNVGLYTLNYYVRDNPKDDDNFDEYRLPSTAVSRQFMVHRRPLALFTCDLYKSGANYTAAVSNISYDPDHQSQSGRGITASVWQWKPLSGQTWTNGSLPASLSPNTQYQLKLTVQDLEGAWSQPYIQTIDTANLPPTVDCDPQSYNGSGPLNVTVTANDQGENDFNHTNYAWSQTTVKPSSWQSSTQKVFNTSISVDGTWYLHMEAFDNAGNKFYRYRGPFTIQNLRITSVTVTGYWNHWRGQVETFGDPNPAVTYPHTMTTEPHRFLSLECVKIDVTTAGDPDKVVIRFSSELEAMTYTDPNGNIYDYNNDFFHYYVTFPQDSTFTPVNNHIHWEYYLPLAPSTKGWDDSRLRPRYRMTVTACKGASTDTYIVDDIDITGNIYDLTYIQPLN